jgi:hypothetical protein
MRFLKMLLIGLLTLNFYGTVNAQELPDLVIAEMWTDLNVVLINQEFTIGYVTKNRSSVAIPRHVRVNDNLYVNGKYHSALGSDGVKPRQTSHGSFKISLRQPGTYTLKIKTDPRNDVRESRESNNWKEVKIQVHDYNSYLRDSLNVHTKSMELIQAYEQGQVTKAEFQLGIKFLAAYSDQLALLSSEVKPQAGLEQFDRYIMVGTKKLSSGLWNIWVGLVDYGEGFRVTNGGRSVVIPLGASYIKEGRSILAQAEVDLLIALSVLVK